MGRWINRDPIGEVGGINLYAAFANSPNNLVDTYGESPLAWAMTGKWSPSVDEYNAALDSAGEDVYEHSPIRGISATASVNVGKYGRVGVDVGWSVDRGASANVNARVGVSLDDPKKPPPREKSRGFCAPVGASYGVSESGSYGRFNAGHSQAGSVSGNAEGGSIFLPIGAGVQRGKVGGGVGVSILINSMTFFLVQKNGAIPPLTTGKHLQQNLRAGVVGQERVRAYVRVFE
jgi:hypothetical protein